MGSSFKIIKVIQVTRIPILSITCMFKVCSNEKMVLQSGSLVYIFLPILLRCISGNYTFQESNIFLPILILTFFSGWCGIQNVETEARMSRAQSAISWICFLPFLLGRPLAIMYASPIVSTWDRKISFRSSICFVLLKPFSLFLQYYFLLFLIWIFHV